jgi:hypothetical protein
LQQFFKLKIKTYKTMSKSRRKTPIFGHTTTRSEKKDKRIANRMFRRITNSKIRIGLFEELPYDMDEIFNVWEMSKDGKSYWIEGKTKDGGKHMRK